MRWSFWISEWTTDQYAYIRFNTKIVRKGQLLHAAISAAKWNWLLLYAPWASTKLSFALAVVCPMAPLTPPASHFTDMWNVLWKERNFLSSCSFSVRSSHVCCSRSFELFFSSFICFAIDSTTIAAFISFDRSGGMKWQHDMRRMAHTNMSLHCKCYRQY